MFTAVCSVLSSAVLFLALVLKDGPFPQCSPAVESRPRAMISVQHNPADGSLSLLSSTPRPELREGELLVKVWRDVPVHAAVVQECIVCR